MARLLLAALVGVVVVWVVRRTSWYLAIDQFGYLTFATDLARGEVSHPSPLLPLFDRFLPGHLDADVLAQTYLYRSGELFCRYAPGFPLILAAASLVFGPDAMHYVNPVAVGVLLIVLYWLGTRALGSEWLGLTVALLVTLFPTYMLLWSISPLRDVPSHVLALTGLAVLVPVVGSRRKTSRWVASGLLFGLAMSTRPDAVLYAIPACGLALFWRPWRARDIVGGALALLVGVAPLLAYNWIATGNPLRPTQFMEFNNVLSRADEPATGTGVVEIVARLVEPATAHAQAPGMGTRAQRLLQGGGLRLANVAGTLPRNLQTYPEVFGPLGVALGVVGAFAALRSLPLFVLTVPYIMVATVFFSLWTRSDPRYLAGSILLFSFLVAYGGAVTASFVADLRARRFPPPLLLTLVGVAAVALIWWVGVPRTDEASARPWVTLVLELALVVAVGVGALVPRARRWPVFAVAAGVALALVAGWRTTDGIGRRASFQKEQVEIARSKIESLTSDRALIFTTDRIGRPAENINFYTDANAVYLQELIRWTVLPPWLMDVAVTEGYDIYLLLPPGDARQWIESGLIYRFFRPEMIANIAEHESRDWFVASAGHFGVPLWFVRMHRRSEDLEGPLGPLPRESAAEAEGAVDGTPSPRDESAGSR